MYGLFGSFMGMSQGTCRIAPDLPGGIHWLFQGHEYPDINISRLFLRWSCVACVLGEPCTSDFPTIPEVGNSADKQETNRAVAYLHRAQLLLCNTYPNHLYQSQAHSPGPGHQNLVSVIFEADFLPLHYACSLFKIVSMLFRVFSDGCYRWGTTIQLSDLFSKIENEKMRILQD